MITTGKFIVDKVKYKNYCTRRDTPAKRLEVSVKRVRSVLISIRVIIVKILTNYVN